MRTVWLALVAAVVFAHPSQAANPVRNQRMQQDSAGSGQASPSQTTAPAVQQRKMSEGPVSLKQRLKENLVQSGFTNVTIMPESFIIQQGNPVTMVVSPDTIAAVEVARASNKMMSRRSVGDREPKFLPGAVRDAAKASFADAQVQSSDHKNAGTIKGIVMGENGELSYLITTANGHEVAINSDVMTPNYDESANTWNASVDATLNQIESAPEAQLQ
jgi:hypothetical protein